MGVKNQCEAPFVFTDPSSIGVVQFKSQASKIGFLKRTNKEDITCNNGEPMKFTSNDTIEQRTVDKELVYIKYHLINSGKIPAHLVDIKWKKGKNKKETGRKMQ